MSIYIVVSEELSETIPIMDDGSGPREPYRMIDLVVADSREQARYLAWRRDKNFSYYIRDMPNFRTRKLSNEMEGCNGVVSDWDQYQVLWDHEKSIELLNSLDRDNF